ncbi:hypothetical protein JXO52_06275 [bacterium]|nr:hypothetical protein [bacterium]
MNVLMCSKSEYGTSFKNHNIEIYKNYVEMADRISQRRLTSNSFFLTINTVIIGAVGYVGFGEVGKVDPKFYSLIAIAGIVLCFLWFALILSYKSMNTYKFKVIHEIEKLLPLAPYAREWELAKKGKDWSKHIPFTYIEMLVPWVFILLHLFVLFYSQRAHPFPIIHC